MNTPRDVAAFLLLGALLPCLFLTFTGTPAALLAWCVAWIALQPSEKRHVS